MVRLYAARIGGNLECDGAHFINPEGISIHAERAQVNGYVFLRGGFHSDGSVRLTGITVGSNLVCSGAQFISKQGVALDLTHSVIGETLRVTIVTFPVLRQRPF